MITCTVCGTSFDPALHPSCGTCPLHSGCSMACCPNCGVSNINPAGSKLASLLQKIFRGEKANVQPALRQPE